MKIRIGHSPDADDAFMYYAIATRKIETENIQFEQVVEDIQSLNERARTGELDVTAISAHVYPLVQKFYDILTCGASMGIRYGPILVAREKMPDLLVRSLPHRISLNFSGMTVAVPGKLTTAYLLLKIYGEDFHEVVVPFDRVLWAVQTEKVDLGLVIHEGQLTYKQYGLVKITDLGKIWYENTHLPVPLGINVIHRSLPEQEKKKIAEVMKRSILYALSHREEAFLYALQYGRGIPEELGKKFILQYVNSYTLHMGEKGKKALRRLFQKSSRRKFLPPAHSLRWI